ncbi:hypothetical protein CHS0354_012472 [Potamilus streckersoni]|uniref:Uncharacterized protein n=1 Tax=Potamilus streckersoni TaxID=2493646 RepID=A0AAE0RZY7_9BIVA|nr:hypothetical protein CHS0354_012472 [Potamilus streckersoni]
MSKVFENLVVTFFPNPIFGVTVSPNANSGLDYKQMADKMLVCSVQETFGIHGSVNFWSGCEDINTAPILEFLIAWNG